MGIPLPPKWVTSFKGEYLYKHVSYFFTSDFITYIFSICRVGFKEVKAIDKTAEFIYILKSEMVKFKPTKEKFVKEFSLKDYNDLVNGWDIKVDRCTKGEQGWGLFSAKKILNNNDEKI